MSEMVSNRSRGLPKEKRRQVLREKLRENPFWVDDEIARYLGVSVQTVRLDRMALGIPAVRERTKAVAERTYGVVKSLGSKEIAGELVDVVLGQSAVSILETTEDMVFEKSRVVRGHYVFAQADSLAIALVDSDVAVTGLANVKFKKPVHSGERLVARAEVIRKKGSEYVVLVTTRSGGEQVFRGKFVVAAL